MTMKKKIYNMVMQALELDDTLSPEARAAILYVCKHPIPAKETTAKLTTQSAPQYYIPNQGLRPC